MKHPRPGWSDRRSHATAIDGGLLGVNRRGLISKSPGWVIVDVNDAARFGVKDYGPIIDDSIVMPTRNVTPLALHKTRRRQEVARGPRRPPPHNDTMGGFSRTIYSRKGSRRSYGTTVPVAIAAPVIAPTMAPTTASSAKTALGAASARTAIKAAKIRVSIVFSMTRIRCAAFSPVWCAKKLGLNLVSESTERGRSTESRIARLRPPIA